MKLHCSRSFEKGIMIDDYILTVKLELSEEEKSQIIKTGVFKKTLYSSTYVTVSNTPVVASIFELNKGVEYKFPDALIAENVRNELVDFFKGISGFIHFGQYYHEETKDIVVIETERE